MKGAARDIDAVGKVYLVEEKSNPSSDYFVLPALANCEGQIVRMDFSQYPEVEDLHNATVVFVRYVPRVWIKLIEQSRYNVQRIVLFMDDDLLDVHASSGMPWSYRLKLMRLTAWRRKWLRRREAELWVSTPFLQAKYADWSPRLIWPVPLPPAPASTHRFFYHGTASHLAEIHWLRPIVDELLRSDERYSFEIIGDHEINRLYREIPRVSVIHPMNWQAYQSFLAIPGRHIGLAPLLEKPFNRARSYTRFFDITRCGAVGIYTQDSIYSEVVTNGVEGLIVAQEPDAWLRAMLSIAEDEGGRQTMLNNAQKKMAMLAVNAP